MKKLSGAVAVAFILTALFAGCSKEEKSEGDTMVFQPLLEAVNSAAKSSSLDSSASTEDLANAINAASEAYAASKN